MDATNAIAVSTFEVRIYRHDVLFGHVNVIADSSETATTAAYKSLGKRALKTDIVEVDENVPETNVNTERTRARKGSYNAKASGLTTAHNGFLREGWADSTITTDKEQMILNCLLDLEATGHEDITCADMAEYVDTTVYAINGSISVLLAKQLVMSTRQSGKRVVALTPRGKDLVRT